MAFCLAVGVLVCSGGVRVVLCAVGWCVAQSLESSHGCLAGSRQGVCLDPVWAGVVCSRRHVCVVVWQLLLAVVLGLITLGLGVAFPRSQVSKATCCSGCSGCPDRPAYPMQWGPPPPRFDAIERAGCWLPAVCLAIAAAAACQLVGANCIGGLWRCGWLSWCCHQCQSSTHTAPSGCVMAL